jgi:LPS-assembly lipoprotein
MSWRASLFALPLLAGCGFTPIYTSSGSSMSEQLASIHVAPVADVTNDAYARDYYPEGRSSRLSISFRDGLSRTMSGSAGSPYVLKASIEERVEGFGVRSDESYTRQRITLIARYELRRSADNSLVYQSEAKSDAGVDRVRSEYATLAAERAAAERNAQQLVRELNARLVLVLQGKLADASGLSLPVAPPIPSPGDEHGRMSTPR